MRIPLVTKGLRFSLGTVFLFIMLFLALNLLAIFALAPTEGVKIYGTNTELFRITDFYVITKEQLFYEFNVMLKYFSVIPVVLMFIVTTNPSEFAASLAYIGVSYKVGYSMAIALRYIPDVQSDFTKIKHAQEARGIEMSAKASFWERLKRMGSIIFPLIFSSMDRIDVVSNAMELRGFGKNKKRTWYAGRKLQRNDYVTLVFLLAFVVLALVITFADGNRFYNPFI